MPIGDVDVSHHPEDHTMTCDACSRQETAARDLPPSTKPVTIQVELDVASMERIEYGNLKLCEHKFGLHTEAIKTLCSNGTVRSKKRGDTRQSQRLYNLDDIRSWLNETPNKNAGGLTRQ